ncbi:NAD+ synthase [Thiomicrospira microaerophila]|uniref:NAD+ synthase n=1 Tax=Thiomicrospira microaerophila TaxID=406020 RepID=UPI00200FD832|nr:NAD+ synthase [Thiomicrospira microaerophila]UQB41396.1 NAD+ synthase [Thiomicrospira microaerophila]
MSNSVQVVMAQIDPLVGDIAGNVERIVSAAEQARDEMAADLVVFPELSIVGYPPEDLLLRHGLYPQIQTALTELTQRVKDVAIVVGYPMIDALGERFNMAAWIEDGLIQASYMKQHLPNYGVFDEHRYFSSGKKPCVVAYKGIQFGLVICEDIWRPGPVVQAARAGAQVILNLNASPFHAEKHHDRLQVARRRVDEVKLPLLYVNQVGGQDELVFDGGSFAMDADGEIEVQGAEFQADLIPVTLVKQADNIVLMRGQQVELFRSEARVYEAIKLGIRDYVHKNGFKGVLLGLSGGIDSALTLALAVDALGAEQVEAVMMPFRYTAEMSIEDAQQQADTMGVKYQAIPIESIYQGFDTALESRFVGMAADLTEENLQARIRGCLLMAMSNKLGKLVLATSNKSESAVGYSTLYGDMVGGFSPLKDVPKTLVYRLARYRNGLSEVIPERVITRAPSAELRPDQKDQDSLPDYEILDAIIKAYVELDQTPAEMHAQGLGSEQLISQVVRLIQRSEYKRRQAAPGVRISLRAFGRDRRYPITSGYKE